MLWRAYARYDFAYSGPYCLPLAKNEQLGFERGSHTLFWKEVRV